MKAEILKSMVIDGRKVVAGDIVDVKGWRHAKALARNRYIRFIGETPKEEIVEKATESKPKASKKKTAE